MLTSLLKFIQRNNLNNSICQLTNPELRHSVRYVRALVNKNLSEDSSNLTAESEDDTSKINSKDSTVIKYKQMLKELSRKQEENVEKIYKTEFGSIRFDDDNDVQVSDTSRSFPDISYKINTDSSGNVGYSKTSSNDNCTHKTLEDLNFVDSQYLGSYIENGNNMQSGQKIDSFEDSKLDLNYIDQQYFYKSSEISSENPNTVNTGKSIPISPNKSESADKSNEHIINHCEVIEDTKFIVNNTSLSEDENKVKEHFNYVFNFEDSLVEDDDDDGKNFGYESNVVSLNSYDGDVSRLEEKLLELSQIVPPKVHFNTSKEPIVKKYEKYSHSEIGKEINERIIDKGNKEINNEDAKVSPQSAYDFVLQKRRKENVAKGDTFIVERYKRILTEVPYFSSLTQHDMVMHLKKSIIYDNHDIVAICKPFGVSLHGGGESKEKRFIIANLLPHLAEVLRVGHLEFVHRLDVNTTGILLLSKSQEMSTKLKKMFKEHKIQKTYLTITKGVPEPLIGLVDIPIAEGTVDNYNRMVLRPDISGFRGRQGSSKQAITKYKVLSKTNSASLVEVNPITGLKHQIRVHLGFGLDCPVLGDHKYSYLTKMAPQKLPSDMLHQLHIKQSRVRDLPICLHSFAVSIPGVEEGRDIVIRTAPPKFFRTTLKCLGLTKRTNRIDETFSEIIY